MQYGIPAFEFILMTSLVCALRAQKVPAQQQARAESHQVFQFSSSPRVEVLNVNGSVIIENSDSDTVEVDIVRLARRERELKYHVVNVEQTPTRLIIQGQENRAAYERGIQVEQQVKLRIPRQASLLIRGIGGSVHVGEIDGAVKVERVAGDLRATVRRLDQSGIRISNIGGQVALSFAEDLNAELEAKSIGGGLYVNLPNVNLLSPESAVSMSARIGAGGSPISILKVGGTVRLTHSL